MALRGNRTVDVVLDWLRKRILEGFYPPGSRLPPERELANQMGITRHTLRTAIARLETENLVETRQGRGATVRDFRIHGSLDLLVHLAAVRQNTKDLVRGFLEIRRGLAAEAVAQACRRATDEQIAALQDVADQQAQETDLGTFIERDFLFSRLTIRAAHNLPLELMFNQAERVIQSRPDIQKIRFQDMQRVAPTYQFTVDLIRQGDAEGAREIVRRFLEEVDAEVLQKIV
jgi:GntR family transcriptional repressor for pyruvate dehydrogenase complex